MGGFSPSAVVETPLAWMPFPWYPKGLVEGGIKMRDSGRSEVEEARVDTPATMPTLFPLDAFSSPSSSPRALCERMGLNWLSLVRLFQSGFISFDPDQVQQMTTVQEAEVIFVGSLVCAGCGETMLERLLQGLRKPYCYQRDRMYYDWGTRAWHLLQGDIDLKLHFDRWLEQLVNNEEVEKLEVLRDSVEKALSELRTYYATVML